MSGRKIIVEKNFKIDRSSNPIILTLREVAELMGLSRSTSYRWFNAGKLPGGRRIGRCIRFHKQTILDFINKS